jgi:SAM-dependent methyltransferase
MGTEQRTAPNHHAGYPGFAGLSGLIAAASMVVGREGDARLAAELSHLRPSDTVVDVGCGPGAAVRRAARLGATVTGVDPAPVMVRAARLLTRGAGTVRYASGSAEALPLPDGSASVVWAIASAHHWADLDAALGELRRVLAPAGRLVVIERRAQPGARGHASHGWTDEQAVAFAESCREHGSPARPWTTTAPDGGGGKRARDRTSGRRLSAPASGQVEAQRGVDAEAPLQALLPRPEPRRHVGERDDLRPVHRIGGPTGLQSRRAGGPDVLRPVRLVTVGEGDNEHVLMARRGDRGPVGRPRAAPHVHDDSGLGPRGPG